MSFYKVHSPSAQRVYTTAVAALALERDTAEHVPAVPLPIVHPSSLFRLDPLLRS